MGRKTFIGLLTVALATSVSTYPAMTQTTTRASLAMAEDSWGKQKEAFDKTFDTQEPIWHKQMRTRCIAKDPKIQIAYFDVDGDSVTETVCWKVLHTKTLGTYVQVMALAKRMGGKIQTAYYILAADYGPEAPTPGGGQALLCDAKRLKVSRYVWKAKDNAPDAHMFSLGTHKPVALLLSTGTCDPTYLFWPKDHVTSDVQFDMETDSPG